MSSGAAWAAAPPPPDERLQSRQLQLEAAWCVLEADKLEAATPAAGDKLGGGGLDDDRFDGAWDAAVATKERPGRHREARAAEGSLSALHGASLC